MKHASLLVLLLLMTATTYAQKKGKGDPTTLRIDSLTQANQVLTLQVDSLAKVQGAQALVLDSVSKHLKGHELMYTAIKEKVVKRDFDPASADALIDSLKAARDQSLAQLTTESQVLTDSIGVLKEENERLKASVATWEANSASNEAVVHDLEQLKALLDQKIITPIEFDQRKARLMAKWK
jgi:hypothetical protein